MTNTGSKRSIKSDDQNIQQQQQHPSNDANDGWFGRLLPWQKRSITGVTDSRADSKITDSQIQKSSMNNHHHHNSHSVVTGTNNGANNGDDEDNNVPRLVLRNLPYAQSHNHIQVRHNYTAMKIYKLIQHDWFHVLLRFPTSRSLFFLISTWTLFLVIWAGCYVWVDRSNTGVECGLGPNGNSISFRGAFAFSLQTCTTGMYSTYSFAVFYMDSIYSIKNSIDVMPLTSNP